MRSATRGFTLLELLVVVAIIALLISLLLPGLKQARAQARQLKCATHLRAQGEAAFFYARDNQDYVVRGTICLSSKSNAYIRTCSGGAGNYATALLRYLHIEGTRLGTAEGQLDLWRDTFPRMTKMHEVFGQVPQYQCTEDPVPESNLHYVSSAMPIPYRLANVMMDRNHLDGDGAGENMDSSPHLGYYDWTTKEGDVSAQANASDITFLTEVHRNVWQGLPQRWLPVYSYTTFYLAAQLPFSTSPRIASDRRHPGGINVLFFDNHVDTMLPRTLDPGFPNSIGVRLRLFSPLHDEVPQKYR